MRQQIVDTVDKHLNDIEGIHLFQWLGRDLEEGEYPAVVMRDKFVTLGYNGHLLGLEFTVIINRKINETTAKESRRIMQLVAEKLMNAGEEMKLNIHLKDSKIDVENSKYKLIEGILNFEVHYTASEWSI